MLIISCHADTGFTSHRLTLKGDGLVYGHLDNFAGVHAVMNAYLSGGFDSDQVRIELTEAEETDFGGAYRVLRSLTPEDVVIGVVSEALGRIVKALGKGNPFTVRRPQLTKSDGGKGAYRRKSEVSKRTGGGV